ncbi:MAG: ATP-binding protein, partial [Chitinophagaceae bacterium]|nr:ATP-binding protein [Chitinophagaceae bacterium]
MSIWNLQKLNAFIQDQVEENINLDYKAADALQKTAGKKTEISKDVSALANAAGGTIIYGMMESSDRRHLPEKIDPVNRIEFSKEWLEQVINSNIQPRISGIVITPVTIDDSSNKVVYVVDIPQSETAHQAADKRYYKRFNFESVPMDDYEIRDIMNRPKHPDVILHFVIERKRQREHITGPHYNEWAEYSLRVVIRNKGKVVANFVNFHVDLPPYIMSDDMESLQQSDRRGDCIEIYGDNTVRDIIDVQLTQGGFIDKYGPSRFDPVLPGTDSRP